MNERPQNSRNKNNAFTKPSSSLSLQIIVHIDHFYIWIYFFCVAWLYIFKGYLLPYPGARLGPEVVSTLLLVFIQYTRLFITSVGNKTETTVYLLYSMLMALPVLVGYIYFFRFQTYVVVYDIVLNILGLIFIAAELILTLIAIFNIKSNEN